MIVASSGRAETRPALWLVFGVLPTTRCGYQRGFETLEVSWGKVRTVPAVVPTRALPPPHLRLPYVVFCNIVWKVENVANRVIMQRVDPEVGYQTGQKAQLPVCDHAGLGLGAPRSGSYKSTDRISMLKATPTVEISTLYHAKYGGKAMLRGWNVLSQCTSS